MSITTVGIRKGATAALLALVLSSPGCASLKSFFALKDQSKNQAPIHNPFTEYQRSNKQPENIVLRTKKGDRSIEVELPGGTADMTDFVVPMSPAFNDTRGRGLASEGGVDSSYLSRTPGPSDRELTYRLPQGLAEDEGSRREIENGLGVTQSEDGVPADDTSYLAKVDHIKQLYRAARFEAALMELDDLLRSYPTDPRLYEMRGTLFDRMGEVELAIKSWTQSLRFDPSNQSLKRFIERKQLKRRLASP